MKDVNTVGRFVLAFVKKYRITVLLWLLLVVFGSLSYSSWLRREGFPDVSIPIVLVNGTYFVDDPAQIDHEVIKPIIAELSEDDEIASFQTSASENTFSVFIEYEGDVEPTQRAEETEEIIDRIDLPQNSDYQVDPILPSKFDNKYDLLLAIYDEEGLELSDLQSRAEKFATELSTADGIESAESVPLLKQTSSGSNEQIQTNINYVATNDDGELEYYEAINIGVYRDGEIDDIELSSSVQNALENIEEKLDYETTKTAITGDFATQINRQLDVLQSNLISGLIAVMIVALLLISWRAALIIALFIPTVIAASFAGIGLLGITINTISLFAIILTLGLFVDDATIVVEAIDAFNSKRASAQQVIMTAMKRIGMASIAGTLTTVLVFAPLLLVSGILGEFIQIMPITIILALLSSLVISLILVPFLSVPLVLGGQKHYLFKRLDSLSVLVPLEERLSKSLSSAVLLLDKQKQRGQVLAFTMISISIASVVLALSIFGGMKFEIFPSAKDGDFLNVEVAYDDGTTIAQANTIAGQINTIVADEFEEEIKQVNYVYGDNRSALVEIKLSSYETRDITAPEIATELEKELEDITGATIGVAQQDAGPPSEDFPFQMRINAEDKTTLICAADEIKDFIADQELAIDSLEEDLTIEEVKIGTTTSITRDENGRFVSILAKFDQDAGSAGPIALRDTVSEEFDEDKLLDLGLSENALNFDVSQESDNAASFSSLGVGFMAALALMYVVLVLLFNSFSQPLLIFLAIPFSLLGVFGGLALTDHSFSFFTMVGLTGLIGIVVNNTILLVDYANQERQSGKTAVKAMAAAVESRFRPLVTTTLTTVAALLPLALSDPFWQALAYTIVFGLISSTFFVIISFPYYYLAVEAIRDWRNSKFPALK